MSVKVESSREKQFYIGRCSSTKCSM